MTPIAVSPYLRAIKTVLDDADLVVGSGAAPKSGTPGQIVTPCTVLHLQPTYRLGDSVDNTAFDGRFTFRCISADITDEGAAAYADRVVEALDGLRLTVTDRASRQIRWLTSTNDGPDFDVTPPCFYVSSLFSLVSNSAPEES